MKLSPANQPPTLTSIAKRLNEHHMKTCAGFYCDLGRFFGARVKCGRLQLSDFETWRDVPADLKFWNHNGGPILFK